MEYKGLAKYKALQEKRKKKENERLIKSKEKEKEKKKEELRQQKLKERRAKYRVVHIKKLRKKQNARAYKKRRDAELAYHKLNGDVHGFYRIVLTKNYEMVEELSSSWWMLTAYAKYNKYIEDNNTGVICEKIIAQSPIQDEEPIKNEILLLKKIDPEADNGIREFRNEIGTFVENRIVTTDKYAIIAKNDWHIPETYNVYGYNPITDRKTGRWIFENIINANCSMDNIKNVFICDNKLIVQYDSDMDFVTCKTHNECIRLYNALQAETNSKFVIYSGFLSNNRKTWLYNVLQEKTGWSRSMLYKNKG